MELSGPGRLGEQHGGATDDGVGDDGAEDYRRHKALGLVGRSAWPCKLRRGEGEGQRGSRLVEAMHAAAHSAGYLKIG